MFGGHQPIRNQRFLMKIQHVRLATGATLKTMINLKNFKRAVLAIYLTKFHETLANDR